MEGNFFGVEVRAIEGIGGPQVWCPTLRIKDLRIKLTCCVDTANKECVSALDFERLPRSEFSRYVTIDDLRHANMSTIRHQVKSLCFDTC